MQVIHQQQPMSGAAFARAWNDEEQQWRSEARIARLTVICSGWIRHVELPLHSTSSLLLIIIAAAAASQQQQQWWLWRSTTGSYVWETIEANSCVVVICMQQHNGSSHPLSTTAVIVVCVNVDHRCQIQHWVACLRHATQCWIWQSLAMFRQV